jgi:hypothetical protein
MVEIFSSILHLPLIPLFLTSSPAFSPSSFFFFGKYVYSSFGCLVSLLFARGRGGGGGGGGVLVLELVC